MPYPNIPAQPTNVANATPQQDLHPTLHDTISEFINEAQPRIVWSFVDEADRDTQWTSPPSGAMAFMTSSGRLYIHYNAWIEIIDVHVAGDATIGAQGNISRLRLASSIDVDESSTGHALQIGPSTATNLRFDPNEVLCVNNGTMAPVYINLGAQLGEGIITGNIQLTDLVATGGGTALSISASNNVIQATSSERFKQNIRPLSNPERALDLVPIEFEYIADPDDPRVGFTAEQAAEVFPEIVNYGWPDNAVHDRETGEVTIDGRPITEADHVPKSIDYGSLVAPLVALVADLTARIEALETS